MGRDVTSAKQSAAALLLMALGLGVLYHAGTYYWGVRTLTICGALLPAVHLTRQMPVGLGQAVAGVLTTTISVLLMWVLAAGLVVDDPWLAYHPYQLSVVISQLFLTAVWWIWLRQNPRDGVAWLGAVLAAAGTGIATHVHWLAGYTAAKPPPASWTLCSANEPVDMVSRVLPPLLPVEMGMVALAVGIGGWVYLYAWLRRE